MSRLYYYHISDIPGMIFPAFKNMARDGQEVFEIPYHTSLYTQVGLSCKEDDEPSRMKIDLRSNTRKS